MNATLATLAGDPVAGPFLAIALMVPVGLALGRAVTDTADVVAGAVQRLRGRRQGGAS